MDSSPRRDAFPAGLRVLVVDDDPTWLRILEKMLKKCSYQVTTCCLAREALNLLRERKDGYDIVISDVNMPDMDGFKLLEHVGLEMDLPVIMMSVDGETSRVMNGVQHGACDYLLKPIRMKELRNIWQHVFRKRIHEAREFESLEGIGIHLIRNGLNQSDDGSLFCLEDIMTSPEKRNLKDADNKHDDKEYGDPSSTKKARVVWSVDLHQKFVKAVNQIGFNKVGPKKILDLMNVPWLTRENVASHLQKYRLYLSRLQKENDQKSSSCGLKLSDLPSKDPPESFGCQNLISRQQNDDKVKLDGFEGSVKPQNVDAKSDLKGISESSSEKRRALTNNIINIADKKIRRSSLESQGKSQVFDCTIPTRYSWSEVPEMQLKQEKESLHLEDSFGPLPRHVQVNVNQLQSVSSGDIAACIETNKSSDYASSIPKSHTDTVNGHGHGHGHGQPIQTQDDFSMNGFPDQRNLASAPLDLDLFWLQGECYNTNLGLQMSEYYDAGLIAQVPTHLYDSADYSVIDQGLFIA
ncbi:hypothetical protein L6164_010716 [Bauhinia variegata]|uniref:Uncharacterized protein n=1 Tax=Bauhinia variegata TaxID=167791 RepID=A0ACB9P4K6_BAUVA|nr:hypothetical protein L6164_010716 [Bauhinia variegata]